MTGGATSRLIGAMGEPVRTKAGDEPAQGENPASRDELEELLRRVAAASRPGQAYSRQLASVVRLLRRSAWLEGELRMELAADGATTVVHLFAEQGGVRERALQAATLDVPLDEIEEALHHAPDLFAPLVMRHHKQRLVFTANGTAHTVHPPVVEIGHESLPHERPTMKRAAYVPPEAFRDAEEHAATSTGSRRKTEGTPS
jgi:hypothetical protein